MLKLKQNRFVEILHFDPDVNMVLSGWDWERISFLFIPCILYFKK